MHSKPRALRFRLFPTVTLSLVLLASIQPVVAAESKTPKPAKTDRPAAEAEPAKPPETPAPADLEEDYWLTVDAMGVRTRHVPKCRFFGNLKGRPCTKKEGRACRECGG